MMQSHDGVICPLACLVLTQIVNEFGFIKSVNV